MKEDMINGFMKESINKNGTDIYLNVLDRDSSDVIIVVHGFDSNKSGSNFNFLAEHLKQSIVSFDLPAHGDSSEKLLLKNCLEDLLIVDSYVRERFFGKNISLFGSSLGSYIILNHLKNNPNLSYKFIFLKSTAVKSAEIFKRCIIDDMNSFKEKGYFIRNRNKEMIIPYEFYEEMVNNKIEKSDINLDNLIFAFHGTCDTLALFSDLDYIKTPNVTIISINGAGHSFDDDDFLIVIDKMKDVFGKAK